MLRLDDLKIGNKKIYQDDTLYNFSTDACLLANFVEFNKNDIVVDFCSGNGIVGILASIKNHYKKMYLFEMQKCLSDLAKKSIAFNSLKDIEVINDKIQNANNYFKSESVSAVTCNPPYKKPQNHKLGENSHLNMCNYEIEVTLEEIIKNASHILKFGGKFYMINDINRLEETFILLNKYGMKAKILNIVQPKIDKPSNVFMIKAVKGAKSGIKVLPTIILNDENGNYLPNIKGEK